MMQEEAVRSRSIAVDFDGTLCYSRWPDLGEPNRRLIDCLIAWKQRGNKLILWTCREGNILEQAVDWCKGHGLEFDAVNDNLPENIALFGNNSRKVSCDLYIDDKSCDLNAIYKKIKEEDK